MRTEFFEFTGANNTKLPAVLWQPDDEARAIVQIIHGMTEHIGRYEAFAEYMTRNGVAVAGFDLRGHGKNPGNPTVASLGVEGWQASLEDMCIFRRLLAERLPDRPQYMLGFSLGSFLLREYLGYDTDSLAGAIIMGTGHQPAAVLSVLRLIVKGQIKKAGFGNTTDLVRQLSFGTYNQKFKPNRTTADWLCADVKQLDAYLEDALCRKDISADLFWELLGSMQRTGSKNAYDHWNKNLPVLLISGQDDPVGDFGKGVLTVCDQMHKAGITRATLKMFPAARHDLLHEDVSGVSEQARAVILRWMQGEK